jgi:simple sugar transport system ATP-binding protein
MPSTTTDSDLAVPVLECRHLSRSYGHVAALKDVSLSLNPGQVVGLVGDNGAGKSTLVRILAGLERASDGTVLIDGDVVHFGSPAQARAAGIETVYQDLALAPDLDGAANLYLGRETRRRGLSGRLGFLDNRSMRATASEVLGHLGSSAAGRSTRVEAFSGGQRQAVAVARALHWARRIFLLDEPTAALGAAQTRAVLGAARAAADGGTAVLLISHDLPEVLAVADAVVVLRQGTSVARLVPDEVTPADVLDVMMGLSGSGAAS